MRNSVDELFVEGTCNVFWVCVVLESYGVVVLLWWSLVESVYSVPVGACVSSVVPCFFCVFPPDFCLVCAYEGGDLFVQETKLTPKAKTPKIHNFTSVRTDRLHKAGGGLITLIRDNITFTTTDIPSTINTHNIKLQMVKVHINNTKHITIANIYIPPRDTTSTHYKTADTDIQHCIQYITNITHSVLTIGIKD